MWVVISPLRSLPLACFSPFLSFSLAFPLLFACLVATGVSLYLHCGRWVSEVEAEVLTEAGQKGSGKTFPNLSAGHREAQETTATATATATAAQRAKRRPNNGQQMPCWLGSGRARSKRGKERGRARFSAVYLCPHRINNHNNHNIIFTIYACSDIDNVYR